MSKRKPRLYKAKTANGLKNMAGTPVGKLMHPADIDDRMISDLGTPSKFWAPRVAPPSEVYSEVRVYDPHGTLKYVVSKSELEKRKPFVPKGATWMEGSGWRSEGKGRRMRDEQIQADAGEAVADV